MKLDWFQMKIIAFRFSKDYFPNAFFKHPGFSKSDCFFISQNHSSGQACMVSMAKRRLAFPFAGFPFPVFSHHLSLVFSSARSSILYFFTSLFNFVQSPFSSSLFCGVSRRRMRLFLLVMISQDLRFNSWLQAVPLAGSSTCHAL